MHNLQIDISAYGNVPCWVYSNEKFLLKYYKILKMHELKISSLTMTSKS